MINLGNFKKILIIILSSFLLVTHAFADDDDSTDVVPAHSKDAIGSMLLQAVSLMGISYQWGGNTPETGMDCSGFIRYVFQKSLGITLPRTAAEMAKVGKRVSVNDLEPGDLMFFNTGRGSNTHIGMYIGNNKFIQSPRTGEKIQITEFDGFYRTHFNGAKRIIQENEDDDGNTTVVDYQNVRSQALPVAKSRKNRHTRRVSSKRNRHSSTKTKKSKTRKRKN